MSKDISVTIVSPDSGDKSVKNLVAAIRTDVRSAAVYGAYVASHGVTRENVAAHAQALAVLAFPKDKPVQTVKDEEGKKTRTQFGNAVQAAAKGMRAHLDAAPKKDRDLLAELAKLADKARDAGHSQGAILAALQSVGIDAGLAA